MIIPWIRKLMKPKVCHDTFTRISSKELRNLQDATRNGVIAARIEMQKSAQHMRAAIEALKEVERKLNGESSK